MPSIKACLASVAIFAITFSPVAASAQPDSEQLARRAPVVLEERDGEAPVQRRSNRVEEAARIMMAKKRAARKIKREVIDIEKRAATPFTGSITPAFATYLGTKCSRDKNCELAQVRAVLPASGAAVCNKETRFCVIDCAPGFLLQNDGSCIQGAITCPALNHGIYTLTNGACTPHCDASLGYHLFGSSTANFKCLNTNIDVQNCGAQSHVCPPSYNGIGKKQCAGGVCGLRCPTGFYQYLTSTGKAYCA